ncbi:MAG TPA: hypothetical protein VIG38_01010 [Hyphomicrobium sp.]
MLGRLPDNVGRWEGRAMRWMKHPFVTSAGLAVLFSLAVGAPALAQNTNGSAGTGGAAGHAFSVDEPMGGAAPMNAPPPMDDAMGAPAPEPMNAPSTDADKMEESAPAPADPPKEK